MTRKQDAMGSLDSNATLLGLLAVAAVAVAVALVLKNARTRQTIALGDRRSGPHDHQAQVQPAIFAAVVKAAAVASAGQEASAAPSLFSNASMRWVGTPEDWQGLIDKMRLPPLAACPDEANKDVIITFAGAVTGQLPSNRLRTRATMSELAADDQLAFAGLFDRPAALNPQRFGFQVG